MKSCNNKTERSLYDVDQIKAKFLSYYGHIPSSPLVSISLSLSLYYTNLGRLGVWNQIIDNSNSKSSEFGWQFNVDLHFKVKIALSISSGLNVF